MITTTKTASQKTPAKGVKTPPLAPTHFHNPNHKSSNSMRMKSTSLTLAAAAVLAALPLANAQNVTATTDPVGFVTVNITAGTGTTKRNTFYSPPLLEASTVTGQASGVITAVSSNSITNSNAGWSAGELSNPATPFLIMVTSGAADGRIFLISSSNSTGGAIAGVANTATTVTISTIDTTQVNLTNLGIVAGTDTYKIFSCDTLSSLLGTPSSTGVLGGTSASNADVVTMFVNGSATNYFYKTDAVPPRWTRQSPAIDASNVPILPYFGFSYARLPASPALAFTITGGVPTEPRQTSVKNSGNTMLSQFWPVDSTFASSGLSSVVTSGANVTVADVVTLTSNGSATNYFYNGTEWRRQSPNIAANSTVIPVGSSVRISRKGSASGYTTLSQTVPYNLQ